MIIKTRKEPINKEVTFFVIEKSIGLTFPWT
jgi:hypothetical protein